MLLIHVHVYIKFLESMLNKTQRKIIFGNFKPVP